MNRRTFNEYLSDGNFHELFITEMGWNNPQGQTLFDITVDETSFEFHLIAERSGFQVLTCLVDAVPTSSFCKKLDTRLRRSANDYICIFMQKGTCHHLWAVPVKKVEKRDIVIVEYASEETAEFLFEKMESLSFGLDERTTIMDVVERVQAAFVVNSEKITKDFYAGFKKEHTNFAKFISGIDDQIADRDNRNKQWYTSVMLNRLMFCYFIQKKGFLDGDVDYLRHKLEWTQQERGENRFFSSFYKGFLTTLFHGGLNAPKHDRSFEDVYGRIPYLNGGMFDVHQLEQDYAGLDIADDAFISLFNFFDKWHWHLDDRLTATGKDINPDVLGYIFEQYINDRAQMGAYYTKEDITEYIGRNTIVPYLMEATRKHDEKPFKPNGAVWQYLKESSNRYIFDAVKKGAGLAIPEEIAIGIDTTKPNLLERRSHWNDRTPEAFALPTEIWRETIERLNRYNDIKTKIENGQVVEINDFITYNLDIRQFVADFLNTTKDHLFIKHFYAELQKVTILDPTCGSGAFLFAALNILEPLYEVCIARMQDFHVQNPNLFKDELQEIEHKYRSNIQYFIYKSIILRNLYGVDIMVEATEIAKLRLFLKMVAVVEVNKREPNLGLDPLPDIDFNIRCGNTLVGYATKTELDRDLSFAKDILEELANQELKQQLEDEMDKVAHAYDMFKHIQLTQGDDMATFKRSKADLKERLKALNDLLNRRMFMASAGADYEAWLASHQPFHWLAEFYEIINGNGGFDVIIGNPPYVVYTDSKLPYQIGTNYKTRECANLYAYCIERSHTILNSSGRFGMIVPNSSISADKMQTLQQLITKNSKTWVSNYSWRPSKLFEGADMLLAIIIKSPSEISFTYSTIYHKWYNEYRPCLFKCTRYTDVSNLKIKGSIPKIASGFVSKILVAMNKKADSHFLSDSFLGIGGFKLFYFRAVQYWFKVLDREPVFEEDGVHKVTGEMKPVVFDSEMDCYATISLLSSNLFFLNYIIWSSCQVVNSRDFNVPIDFPSLSVEEKKQLAKLGKELQNDYQAHSHIIERNYSTKGRVFTMQKQHFFIKYSKPIIDEIDKVLAKHYGFTEEELDFIINYDIKYRMGDELNEE
ncbi:MAG: Eco57I restriction-modification methylase domain-containing protein [Bacteroidales bacterium]|nr:Eco57I restriction-modification methylase domain-containing protein [Bacteroidales bacterium]